jgi:hypothetical protein
MRHEIGVAYLLGLHRGVWFAVVAATMPVIADASARALPYPGTWPARTSSACRSIQGHYWNQPLAVDDAGQRMQSLRLSDLLSESPLSIEPRPAGPTRDDDAFGGGARYAEIRLGLAREVVALSTGPDGRVGVAVDSAPPALSSRAQCRRHGKRDPALVVDPIALEPGRSTDASISHLVRIGIRQAKIEVFSADGGDLILRLAVTKRPGREETFGYRPIKHYWLRYARIEPPAE